MTCPSCGLALPREARFCARCGARLDAAAPAPPVRPASPAAPGTPVWLLVLLWLGAGATLWVSAIYVAVAAGIVPRDALGPGVDPASVQGAAALVAACAGSLCLAHLAAAVGLMRGRPWARTFATMVCVVWALSCVGLPLGLLGISALWRPRRDAVTSPRPPP